MKAIKLLLLMLPLIISGCYRSYVDPSYSKYSYSDIIVNEEPVYANISSTYKMNGNVNIIQNLRSYTIWALEKTKVVKNQNKPCDITIDVVINEKADSLPQMAGCFISGFTLGLIGTSGQHEYDITISYSDDSGVITDKNYQHLTYFTAGIKDPPLNAVPEYDSMATVLSQVMRDYVVEMQRAGYFINR